MGQRRDLTFMFGDYTLNQIADELEGEYDIILRRSSPKTVAFKKQQVIRARQGMQHRQDRSTAKVFAYWDKAIDKLAEEDHLMTAPTISKNEAVSLKSHMMRMNEVIDGMPYTQLGLPKKKFLYMSFLLQTLKSKQQGEFQMFHDGSYYSINRDSIILEYATVFKPKSANIHGYSLLSTLLASFCRAGIMSFRRDIEDGRHKIYCMTMWEDFKRSIERRDLISAQDPV